MNPEPVEALTKGNTSLSCGCDTLPGCSHLAPERRMPKTPVAIPNSAIGADDPVKKMLAEYRAALAEGIMRAQRAPAPQGPQNLSELQLDPLRSARFGS
jgi:hypothetical protein